MGWKASSIIINSSADVNYEGLLKEIGFANLKAIENEPYDIAIYPDKDKVYIGSYKGNIIISCERLPLSFFDKELSSVEKNLTSLFPDSEICAVSLYSSVNHFGFSISKKGKKIRVKVGDAENGTVWDIGEPLEQELELLSKSKFNEDGKRIYSLENLPNDYFTEDQVGENFVFEIYKRYTGERLDLDDELLFETHLKGFQFSPLSNEDVEEYIFSGEWAGTYTYGDGYKESIKGKKEDYIINMEVVNGRIEGMCQDLNKGNDSSPITIYGFIAETFIGFVKEYELRYQFNEKNEIEAHPSKIPYRVIYSGLYDKKTDSFRGIWRIEGANFWGEWAMKRS